MVTGISLAAQATLLAFVVSSHAASPFLTGYGAETMTWQVASPTATWTNCNVQDGASIENDHQDDSFALLQVDFHMDNTTQDVALIGSHQGHLQARQILSNFSKQTMVLQSNAALSSSFEESRLAGPSFFFTLGGACILCVLMLICFIDPVGLNQEKPHYSTQQKRHQDLTSPLQRNSPRGANAAPRTGSASGMPGNSLGKMSSPAATPVSAQAESPHLQARVQPIGTPSQSQLEHRQAQQGTALRLANDGGVGVAAGIPMICPALVLPNTEARFQIPMHEISGVATAGHIEKLDIKGSSGRTLLYASVLQTPEDQRKAFVISSVGGDLPRVYIKPRGFGEPFDVIGPPPKRDTYGTLAPTGNSGAVLRCGDQPVMTIKKVADLPHLHMTAHAIDGQEIAKAVPSHGVGLVSTPENERWMLTVKPGADAVLISACMISLILFGGTSS